MRLSMFFLNVHHMIPEFKFLDYLKEVLLPSTFDTFLHDSILIELHCLGEARYVSKQ